LKRRERKRDMKEKKRVRKERERVGKSWKVTIER
jgi:hypothetical protein